MAAFKIYKALWSKNPYDKL